MASINLLPWRAERRIQRTKEFHLMLIATALLSAAIVFSVYGFYMERIAYQNERNEFLNAEIRTLNSKINEIEKIRTARVRLIERMNLIQNLQGNRPVIVRMFDTMARLVPDDLYFTEVSLRGDQVSIKGMAKSNNRVATLMRNFDQSEWFKDPALIRVVAKDNQLNEFEISLTRIVTPAGVEANDG